MERGPAGLDDLRLLTFRRIGDEDGALWVYEAENHLPIPVRRTFVVRAGDQVRRGHHAHRACSQVLVCLAGACRVEVCDGRVNRTVILDSPDAGLYIPPSLWAEQTYLGRDAMVMVFCDLPYDESDYIRDWKRYLVYRGIEQGGGE